MLIYEKQSIFPERVVLGNFFNLNCILRGGNCPFIISKMKNSFHLKLLFISQFKIMSFFKTWPNIKHFKVIKMTQC